MQNLITLVQVARTNHKPLMTKNTNRIESVKSWGYLLSEIYVYKGFGLDFCCFLWP